MKKLIFAILTISLSLSYSFMRGQVTFRKFISTEKDEHIRYGLYTDDECYVFIMYSGTYKTKDYYADFYDYRNVIIKTDKECNITDSISINIIQNHEILLKGIIGYNDTLLMWGGAINLETNDEQLIFIWLDKDLNILRDTILGNADIHDIMWDSEVNHNNNIVFIGSTGLMWTSHIVLYEISKSGVIQNMKYDSLSYASFPSDIIELTDQKKYHVDNGGVIIQYNSDLEPDTVIEPRVYSKFHSSLVSKLINGSEYIKIGIYMDDSIPPTPNPWNTSYLLVDTMVNVIDSNIFITQDTMDSPVKVDFLNIDSIFLGSIKNSFINECLPLGLYPENRYLALYCFSLFGEVHWEKFYGGDANYVMSNITPTKDGGCLMISSYYDWHNNPVQERDVMFLKVNKEGMLGVPDMDIQKDISIGAFPNPAHNYVIFRIPVERSEIPQGRNSRYQISDTGQQFLVILDLFGRWHDEIQIPKGQELVRIDVSTYPAGIYFAVLKNEKRILGRRKFVVR
ncbi:MAG: T9SS type A sorting domain-containing protein [Bacteroidales bacterium]|nr:T9SS type A sorting domain-containing protein [Bacteroidales bacterium]